MKLNYLIVLLTLFSKASASQTNKLDQVQLRVINNLFRKLKNYKIDTEQELIWRYTYSDSSKTTLSNFSKIVDMENLKTENITLSTLDTSVYSITISEIKKYTPEQLLNRIIYVNEVAKYSRIKSHFAIIEAENQKRNYNYEMYKPVGKKQKAIKE